MQCALAGVGYVVDDVAPLLAQRGRHRQHSLDEAAALRAVRAEADLANQHAESDGALGRIVRRLDAEHADECPQRGRELENVPARRLDLGMTAAGSLFEEALHLGP